MRTHTDGHTQRPRPRARLGGSACSSPTTVYYDALESVLSEDEGRILVCPGLHTKQASCCTTTQRMALSGQQPLQHVCGKR